MGPSEYIIILTHYQYLKISLGTGDQKTEGVAWLSAQQADNYGNLWAGAFPPPLPPLLENDLTKASSHLHVSEDIIPYPPTPTSC